MNVSEIQGDDRLRLPAELRAENDARLARLMAQFDQIDAMIAKINQALGGKKNAPSDK